MAVNDSQTYGGMIDGVEHVSNLITRYTILESIYLGTLSNIKPATHDQLQSSLTKLYVAILAYLTKARRYYDKSTVGEYLVHFLSSIVSIAKAGD